MEKIPENSWDSIGLDPLTGLHNRSYLDTLKESYLRSDDQWSLLMLDVDHFKLINDIYGHLTGDKVLKQTALNIQVNLKKTDIAIRFGGDEFIIILPDTDKDGALDLAQRLMFEIDRMNFPSGVHVSLSMGVSQSRESDESITDLVSRADKALYRAKEAGRGRFFFFSEDLLEIDTPDITLSHMVGRRPELQKLRQLLEESVTDSSRLALITGDAGVGKTRLVDELLNYCDFMKVLVVRNNAHEHQRSQPFSILVEPIKESLSRLSYREVELIRRKIEPVHPATLDLFPELQASVMDDVLYFREERLRFRIFRDMAVMATAISKIRPLAIILDDLQWASEQDIELLSFVVRNTTDANLFYICILCRDDMSDDIYRKLSSVRSSVPLLNMEIATMTPEEIRNMILFSLKDPNVPEEVQNFLISQSGGNPLFLRELLSSCVESGYITMSKSGEKIYSIPEDVTIPESLGKIITSKLANISSEAMDILKIVSLSPDYFSIALLEGMTGKDQIELARRLDECIKAGIIEELREGRGGISFRFTYGAVREFLSSELPDSLRCTYHQRMAAYYQAFYDGGRDELLTTVAYHFSRSMDNANAGKFALKAAQNAFKTGANRDAISWYSIFLEKMPLDSVEPEILFNVYINLGALYSITGFVEKAQNLLKEALELSTRPIDLAAVYLRLGRNHLNSSNYPETLMCFNKAVALCSEIEETDQVIFTTVIESYIETSFVHRLQGNYKSAISCLDKARDLLREHRRIVTEDIHALYYTRRADVNSETGSTDKALETYEKALGIYRRIGDLQGEATVLNNMHSIYALQGDYEKSLSTMEEVLRLNTKLDDKLGLAIGFFNMAEYYQGINMLDLAREYYDKYLEMNGIINNELGVGYGMFGLGKLHWLEGEFEKSHDCFESAIKVFSKLRVPEMQTECDLMLAQISVYMGKLDEAGRILDSIPEDSFNPSIELNTNYMKGLVLISSPQASQTDLKKAQKLFRNVLNAKLDTTETDIAMHYTALATTHGKMGQYDEMKNTLKEGAVSLAKKLGDIGSYSIRNSIMTRREIVEFTSLCEKNGLLFPPDGHAFSTSR